MLNLTLPRIIRSALTKVGLLKAAPTVTHSAALEEELCCDGYVHIFYRGISDDHIYKSADRHWREVKYFRPNGLKVFCRQCRRRLY